MIFWEQLLFLFMVINQCIKPIISVKTKYCFGINHASEEKPSGVLSQELVMWLKRVFIFIFCRGVLKEMAVNVHTKRVIMLMYNYLGNDWLQVEMLLLSLLEANGVYLWWVFSIIFELIKKTAFLCKKKCNRPFTCTTGTTRHCLFC